MKAVVHGALSQLDCSALPRLTLKTQLENPTVAAVKTASGVMIIMYDLRHIIDVRKPQAEIYILTRFSIKQQRSIGI